jgi:hypothetical protein
MLSFDGPFDPPFGGRMRGAGNSLRHFCRRGTPSARFSPVPRAGNNAAAVDGRAKSKKQCFEKWHALAM